MEEHTDRPTGAGLVPGLGQSFASFQAIEALLGEYARAHSFMVIIMRSQRPEGRVVQATFGCHKSGSYRPNRADPPHKRTIKTNCPFQINVRYSDKNGDYRITKIDLEHNHEMDLPEARVNVLSRGARRKSGLGEEGRRESLGAEQPVGGGLVSFCDMGRPNLDFDLLSGLELPEDIAQEVSAAMTFRPWSE